MTLVRDQKSETNVPAAAGWHQPQPRSSFDAEGKPRAHAARKAHPLYVVSDELAVLRCDGALTSTPSIEARRTKYDQRFDRPTPITKESMDLEIEVDRVGLNFRKGDALAAYRTRVL